MSLDSILENPSLKNMILNNAVRDYQGYLTGFSSNNYLETFAPQEVREAINKIEANRTVKETAESKKDHIEDEAAKTITSRILNTSIGAFYLKDILKDGNIIDDVITQKVKHEVSVTDIQYNKYRETFVVLTEGNKNKNIAPSMEAVLLRKYDSIEGAITVDNGKNHFYGGESDSLMPASMSAMTVESKRVPAADLNFPITVLETKTVASGDYVLTADAQARITEEKKQGIAPSNDSHPDDYVQKRVKIKVKRIKGQKTIKRYKIKNEGSMVNKSYNEPKQDEGNLVAIVIKNPKYSMPTRNQNYLSVFFNAISQLDMSLATPYLELTFFSIIPNPGKEGKGENKLNQTAYMRFDNDSNLMNISRFVINPARSNIDDKTILTTEQAKLNPSDAASQRHMDPTDQTELGFQNIFQTPQTLNNADINRAENLFGGKLTAGKGSDFVYDSAKIVLDPFAPMLSLENFNVTVSEGGYYAVSSRQADMNLILHDRSRLADITPFVTPGAIQHTSVKVTYGWSHPLSNPHHRESRHNIIANFIDSMRETAYYRLSSSNLKLEGSQIKISVKMDFMGGREFRKIPVTTGVKKDMSMIKETFAAAIKLITKRFDQDTGKVHQNYRIVEQAIDSYEELVETEDANLLFKLISYYSAPKVEIDSDGQFVILKQLCKVIGLFTQDELAAIESYEALNKKIKKADLTKKQIGVSARQSQLSREIFYKRLQSITSTIDQINLSEPIPEEHKKTDDNKNIEKSSKGISITPDYFTTLSSMHYLYEKKNISNFNAMSFISGIENKKIVGSYNDKSSTNNFPKGFVSLGKLIQNLVAYPMIQTNQYNEIQVIYYPTNAESAGARKHTTASLPISVDRLYETFDKHMKVGNFMTPDSVFKILSNMLQDRNSVCYELFSRNSAIEKELEELYGYKNKDGKISLNSVGQRLAYDMLAENFVKNKKSSYPTLNQIIGPAGTGSGVSSSGSGSASAAVASEINSNQNSKDPTKASEPDPKNYEQPMYENFIKQFKQDEISSTLEKIYNNDGLGGPADLSSFKMVHLVMDIEPCQVLHSVNGRGDKIKELISLSDINAPYATDARILRIHIYDAHLSPRNGLSFISEKVTNGTAYLRSPHNFDIETAGIAEQRNKNIGNASPVEEKQHGERNIKLNSVGDMIVNMPPWLLKKYLKREYPSITYGASNAIIKSINLSSTTENEISYGKAIQTMQDQEEGVYSKFVLQDKMDLNIIPSTIDMQIMGCPFLKVCGHIYVDTGTNTDMDNVYSIVSFSHSISPGNFVTSVNLALPFAASTSNLRSSLANSLSVASNQQKENNES
jgi:hypothetical protein